MADYTIDYTAHDWVDGQNPALSASNLNDMDAMIQEVAERTQDLKSVKLDMTSDYVAKAKGYAEEAEEYAEEAKQTDVSELTRRVDALADIVGEANDAFDALFE